MDELKNIVDLYYAQLTVTNSLWSLFIVVSIGLAGLIYSKEGISKLSLLVITSIYLGFSLVNHIALLQSQVTMYKAQLSIQEIVEEQKSKYTDVAKYIVATEPKDIEKFHLIMIIIITLSFWIPTFISWCRDKLT